TGESGGATQTYLLAAVDDRVGYVAPVNMLSAHYAGGCVCENAPGLRLDLTNMEVVAAAAPRPMLIVAATGDWTVNTPRVEFPAVQAVYDLFNARDQLECVQIDAGHNYNQDSREAVYGFFARHWGGNGATTERPASAVFWTGPSGPAAETPNSEIEDVAPLRVFPDGTSLPSGALQDALQVTDAISARFLARFDAALPGNSQTLEHFKSVYRPAYEHALHARLPGPDEVRLMHRQRSEMHGLSVERMDIGTAQYGEEIPAIYVSPSSAQSDAVPVLLVSPEGKRAWLSDSQLSTGSGGALQSIRQPRGDAFVPLVNELLAAGRPVLIVDTFLTGEYLSPVGAAGRPVGERHFTTYNRADVAWRAQDVLTCAAALSVLSGASTVDIVGWGDAGLWCLLARPFAPSLIRRLAADLNSFAWDAEADYLHRLCLPHVLRLGGLAGAIALAAPAPLYLQNGEVPPWLPDLYDALGAGDALSIELPAPSPAPAG
ncbi:MAG TPA: hypothetical protein VGW38_21610, partial [Chloroflexota bacterium]|nr:hypothetical protein [Chloroflexota bacterium]